MDLVLKRTKRGSDGIFSELFDSSGKLIAHTLEHAYPAEQGFDAKIPNGSFACQRGEHRLHGMDHTFSTFEITGIAGHQNLLFHWGNYNRDSEGCILVGQAVQGSAITNSRATFASLMALEEGLNQFSLTVEG